MTEKTIITFLLDRSGSMQNARNSTIEAFNGYLEGLRNGEGEVDIDFTFLQFDTQSLDKLHINIPIHSVPNLTSATFVPRGGTPLIDAAVKTIKAVEEALIRTDGKPKIVICILTDGYENASTEHTVEELRALVQQRTAEGWQFNFIGAGIDAYSQAAVFGIGADKTMSYNKGSPISTQAAFAASAANARGFAAGSRLDTNYTDLQKSESGDLYQTGKTSFAPQKSRVQPQDVGRSKTVDDFSL